MSSYKLLFSNIVKDMISYYLTDRNLQLTFCKVIRKLLVRLRQEN